MEAKQVRDDGQDAVSRADTYPAPQSCGASGVRVGPVRVSGVRIVSVVRL